MKWLLDPDVTYLNHGGFGALTVAVAERQRELRAEIAANPTRFLGRELEGRLDVARERLAWFVDSDPEALAWVPNATTGVNTVLRMFEGRLGVDDEILVTDHEYNACRNALDVLASRTGATIRMVTLPFPVSTAADVTAAIMAGVSDATRLALIDHITSQSAMVLPVQEIVAALESKSVPVIVDGAHAPGMVDLDLDALDASFYVGNCHKWLGAPHGAAFLRVSERFRSEIEPLVISHGLNDARNDRSRFRKLFDWTGTDDPTAALCVPLAIEVVAGEMGWSAAMAANHWLAVDGRQLILDRLGLTAPVPDEMVGSMAAIRLPDSASPGSGLLDPLTVVLADRHRIEAPVFAFPQSPSRVLRVSAQLYNTLDEYERLARVLEQHLDHASA